MTAIMASTVGVKTMADNTLRLTIDIEPRYAQEAFALFGVRGSACAIARLKNEAAVEAMREEAEDEKPKGGPLAKLAGMWCNSPAFRRWANATQGTMIASPIEAAHWIRTACQVDSRAELDSDKEAADIFHAHIREPFSAYLAQLEGRRAA